MLRSPYFVRSKRYPALLEYAVVHTLEGNLDALNERAVAMEIFGRTVEYEPNTDSVVRNATGEVRKRIALYNNAHPEVEVRIELPPGSYAAEFHWRKPEKDTVSLLAADLTSSAEAAPEVSLRRRSHAKLRLWAISASILILLLAVMIAAVVALDWRKHEEQDFLRPMLHGDASAIILLGRAKLPGEAGDAANESNRDWIEPEKMILDDAVTAALFCDSFRAYGRDCKMVSLSNISLAAIRNDAVVLVGALDVPWTVKLQEPLCFRFQHQQARLDRANGHARIISDCTGRQAGGWRIVGSDKIAGSDFAIVARFESDVTNGPVLLASGLSHIGTVAAGQFLIHGEENYRRLRAFAPKEWDGKNFEAVLQVDIIQGNPGAAKIVATRFW